MELPNAINGSRICVRFALRHWRHLRWQSRKFSAISKMPTMSGSNGQNTSQRLQNAKPCGCRSSWIPTRPHQCSHLLCRKSLHFLSDSDIAAIGSHHIPDAAQGPGVMVLKTYRSLRAHDGRGKKWMKMHPCGKLRWHNQDISKLAEFKRKMMENFSRHSAI